jgi:hypothetical protein
MRKAGFLSDSSIAAIAFPKLGVRFLAHPRLPFQHARLNRDTDRVAGDVPNVASELELGF